MVFVLRAEANLTRGQRSDTGVIIQPGEVSCVVNAEWGYQENQLWGIVMITGTTGKDDKVNIYASIQAFAQAVTIQCPSFPSEPEFQVSLYVPDRYRNSTLPFQIWRWEEE